MENPVTIGERVKQLRSEHKWSQYTLADNSGVNRQIIHLIESGRVKKVDYDNVRRLAEAFNVDPDWLVGTPHEKTDKDELITDLELAILQLKDVIKRLRNL